MEVLIIKTKLLKICSLFLCVFITTSCNDTKKYEDLDYKDFEQFSLSTLDDLYSLKGTYCVELYYPTCSHCVSLKPYLFKYLDEYERGEKTTKVYFFDVESSTTANGKLNRAKFKLKSVNYNREELILDMKENKPSTLSETYFFGTPSLYVIENNSFKDLIVGDKTIASYFNSLK